MQFWKRIFVWLSSRRTKKGVEKVLENMKEDEIYRDMTLMGCKSISELNRSKIIFRK